MAVTFVGPLKRTELLKRVVVETPHPCRAPQWRCAETKGRYCANRLGLAGRAGLNIASTRETLYPAASAQSASARRTRLASVRIRRRELQCPKLFESQAPNKIRRRDPYRSRSFQLIL